MRSRWRRLLTFGYGIRRPSAPYQLAAHDWTCDRAIIALEHVLPFSSAYIFLFFVNIRFCGFYWTGIRVADEARISGIQISPHQCSIGKYDYLRLEHDLAPAAKVHKGHRARFFRRPAADDPSLVDVAEKVKQEALRWTTEIRAEAHRQHLVVVFDPTQFQTANPGHTDNQDDANPAVTKRAKTSQSESTPSQATSDLQDSSMHDTGASIDPRSHGPTFPPGFYLAARPIYDLASAISASATDVIGDQIAGGKIGEKESRDRALAQSTPATSSTPSKRSLPSRPSRPAPTA